MKMADLKLTRSEKKETMPCSVVSADGGPEAWRAVTDFDGAYEVSSLGRVKSLDRQVPNSRGGGVRTIRGTLRRQSLAGKGYLTVSLWRDNTETRRYVSRMVLEAFVGACPEGMEACHNNGNRTDNQLTNLRWDTPVANQADKIEHGTVNRGERHGLAKLTSTDVERIFDLHSARVHRREIASWFGVVEHTVGKIIRGERWAHVRNAA